MAKDIPIERTQVFDFHPKQHKDNKAILTHLDPKPSPLASFLRPAFGFYRVLGMCPSSFIFDKKTDKFVHVRGSWLRRTIWLIMGALIALHCYGSTKVLDKHQENNTISAMQKILGLCYIFFILSFFRAFLLNGELFKDIFDNLQDTYKVTLEIGCKFPSMWKIRLAQSCLLICCIGVPVCFSISIAPMPLDSFGGMDWYAYFESFGTAELQMLNSILGQDGNSSSNVVNLDGGIKVMLGVVSFLVHLGASFCWGGAICLNTLWALMFWLLLHQFFQIVSKNATRNTLKDIRYFNAITGLIDKYNEAYSCVILAHISTGTVHFSMNIFRIFGEDVGQFNGITALGTFIWFGLMLMACSQVHRTACDIVQVIKGRFQADAVWSSYHGNCIEAAQGLTLVLHETQMNSIGFKGLGFFTCTYSFIGTILSAITTYAIIVLQFHK